MVKERICVGGIIRISANSKNASRSTVDLHAIAARAVAANASAVADDHVLVDRNLTGLRIDLGLDGFARLRRGESAFGGHRGIGLHAQARARYRKAAKSAHRTDEGAAIYAPAFHFSSSVMCLRADLHEFWTFCPRPERRYPLVRASLPNGV